MSGQASLPAVPTERVARRFLSRCRIRDLLLVIIGTLLVATGVGGLVLIGYQWNGVTRAGVLAIVLGMLVLGVVLLAPGATGLWLRRGAGRALLAPARQLTAAKFARRLIALRDKEDSVELRVSGQVGRLPSDADATVVVFGGDEPGAALVIVHPATAAVVVGRLPA
jgi:hypothetical protein